MTTLRDDVATCIFLFGFAGLVIGSLVQEATFGVILGSIVGLITGLSYRHKHNWQRGIVYNEKGEPQFMLKFCSCGETQFDGWFERKREKP